MRRLLMCFIDALSIELQAHSFVVVAEQLVHNRSAERGQSLLERDALAVPVHIERALELGHVLLALLHTEPVEGKL